MLISMLWAINNTTGSIKNVCYFAYILWAACLGDYERTDFIIGLLRYEKRWNIYLRSMVLSQLHRSAAIFMTTFADISDVILVVYDVQWTKSEK